MDSTLCVVGKSKSGGPAARFFVSPGAGGYLARLAT
jgi:hypothetical protein